MESSSSAVLVAKGKWEDLNTDLLHNIFQRAELGVKLFDLPLVCKSWYEASVDPQILQTLDFTNVRDISCNSDSDDERRVPRKILVYPEYSTRSFQMLGFKPRVIRTPCVPIANLVQLAIERSQGTSTNIILSSFVISNFSYIAQGCRALKTVKVLSGYSNDDLVQIFDQIKAHCKNFEGLTLKCNSSEDALAIATYIPDIKYLTLIDSVIPRESLILILRKCRKLELLDVRKCVGFDAEDDEILKMASHIKTFLSEGSVISPTTEDDYYDYLPHDGWCYSVDDVCYDYYDHDREFLPHYYH